MKWLQKIKKFVVETAQKAPLVYMIVGAWLLVTVAAVALGRTSDDPLATPVFAKLLTKNAVDVSDVIYAAESEKTDEPEETPEERVSAQPEEIETAEQEQIVPEKAAAANDAGDAEEPLETEDTEDADTEAQEDTAQETAEAVEPEIAEEQEASVEEAAAEETGSGAAENAVPQQVSIVKSDVTVYETYTPVETDSIYYTDPGLIPLTTAYAYVEQTDYSYFDDALFIGDSRMVGLRDYSVLSEHADFACMTGLTIYNALDELTAKDPATGSTVSASYLLSHYQYGKVYLCVGINELGIGNTAYFANHFQEVIEYILSYQPDAYVFIQSIMAVSAQKNDSDPVFNNININDKNAAIAAFADGQRIFYLNINEFFTDDTYTPHSGALRAELTTDQVHIYGNCYASWADILLGYGV